MFVEPKQTPYWMFGRQKKKNKLINLIKLYVI